MAKTCDHKSVGMFVWKNGNLLLIERAKSPFGYAVPAGHVDDDLTFEAAAIRELKEEVGLQADHLELIGEGVKHNQCRRLNGDWHEWKVYKVETSGEVSGSADETKRVKWYSPEEIRALAEKTKRYLAKEISETDWEKNPGLEPIMLEWFTDLKIL